MSPDPESDGCLPAGLCKTFRFSTFRFTGGTLFPERLKVVFHRFHTPYDYDEDIYIIIIINYTGRMPSMIFTMNSQDLLEGLNTVTRALAPRAAKQILEGVQIVADSGRVTMTCSDGSLTIEYTNAADIQEEGQTVLPGRIFNEMIRKMPQGDVKISVQDSRSATIRCMKNRSSLAIMNAAEYPELSFNASGTCVKIQQKKLKDMISHVVFAVATDESRQILTGSLLEVSRTEARLIALDGFRLSMQKVYQPFELGNGTEMIKAVIPGKVLTELSRILPDDEAFCNMVIEKGRLQCTFGNIRLSSSLLSGEYIDYRRIIPSDFKTEVKVNRGDVQDAIERASLMAREGKNNLIKMSFKNDSLKISSNAEMGNVEEEMEASLHGEELDIAFNSRYIMDVIRNVTEEELCMKFNSNVSPCVIVPQTGDDYLYLILPVRVFQ